MRKEYAQARALAISQAQVLQAHDEIKMATTRLQLRVNEDDKSLNALTKDELPSASVQYTSDKFMALHLLSCTKGKLRYLKVHIPTFFSCSSYLKATLQYYVQL